MEHGAWCLQQTGFTGLLKAGCRFDVRVRQVATRPAPVLEFLRMVICSCSNQGLFSLSLFFFCYLHKTWMKGTATTQDKTKKKGPVSACLAWASVGIFFLFLFLSHGPRGKRINCLSIIQVGAIASGWHIFLENENYARSWLVASGFHGCPPCNAVQYSTMAPRACPRAPQTPIKH